MHKRQKNNSSGYTGVFFNKKRNKWTAGIKFNNKYHFLGEFLDYEAAVNARKKAENEFEQIRDKDIIGKKYENGRLTVLQRTEKRSSNKSFLYKCQCECGNIIYARLSHLKNGNIKSCGCLLKDNSKLLNSRSVYFEGTNIDHLKSINIPKNNTSGFKGVCYLKNRKKWQASLMIKGKTIHLGTFERIEDAIRARKNGEIKYYLPALFKYYESASLPINYNKSPFLFNNLITIDQIQKISGLPKKLIISRLFRYGLKSVMRTGKQKTKKSFYNIDVLQKIMQMEYHPRNSYSAKNIINKGISERTGKYRINISLNGKMFYLGTADDIQNAINRRNTAIEHYNNGTFEIWYNEICKQSIFRKHPR
jgi:hypothetical protein